MSALFGVLIEYQYCVLIFGLMMVPLRLRWSRGSVLAFGTQVRGFKPVRNRRLYFPSFGGEVKPTVPCRRFAACKRSLNLRGSRNLGKITTGHLSRPQFHLSLLERRGTWWRKWEPLKAGKSNGKLSPRMCLGCSAKSHIGSITGLWFLPDRPLGLNTNE